MSPKGHIWLIVPLTEFYKSFWLYFSSTCSWGKIWQAPVYCAMYIYLHLYIIYTRADYLLILTIIILSV